MFELLGKNEDHMTFALGFVASRSPCFARAIARALGTKIGDVEGTVRLQDVDGDGRTDVELYWGETFHAILEAKRGRTLPTTAQLAKYARRLRGLHAERAALVAVTNASEDHARRTLPAVLDGIPVKHLSWQQIRHLAREARRDETHRNKYLLAEFNGYLEEVLGMETGRSNFAYVVSLSEGGVWGVDFKDVVNKKRRYFFPVEGKWPDPPSYIAFRYDGKLQSIHHVEGHDVFTNPHDVFKDARDMKIAAHHLLRLGPAFGPSREVRTGDGIHRAMRVWVRLDLLLTCETVTEALEKTRAAGSRKDAAA